MKLKKKEEGSMDTLILLEVGIEYPQEEIQRQSVEVRLSKRPSRDCSSQGSISYTVTMPRYHCVCQQVRADRRLK